MSILFVGRAGLGGACMRGRDVAARMGETFVDWEHLPSGKLDTVVVVKYWQPAIRDLRKRCRLLVHDPLDCWTQTKPKDEPIDFWRWVQSEVQCDLMLGCSPSAVETMQSADVKAVCAPHHADERVGTDWYDPNGPVVYAGGERFLGDERPRIEAACKESGREFVCRFDKECWKALQGAALSLCVRFDKERTPLNLHCKPAVKVANAARAGIPVLATVDESIWSINVIGCEWLTDGIKVPASIALGLGHASFHYPFTLETHCELLRELCR